MKHSECSGKRQGEIAEREEPESTRLLLQMEAAHSQFTVQYVGRLHLCWVNALQWGVAEHKVTVQPLAGVGAAYICLIWLVTAKKILKNWTFYRIRSWDTVSERGPKPKHTTIRIPCLDRLGRKKQSLNNWFHSVFWCITTSCHKEIILTHNKLWALLFHWHLWINKW